MDPRWLGAGRAGGFRFPACAAGGRRRTDHTSRKSAAEDPPRPGPDARRDQGQRLGFQIGANPAMQYSIEQLCNFRPELKPHRFRAYEPGDQAIMAATLPTAYIGIYTPIKNQASCGCCWAFSTIAGHGSGHQVERGAAYDLSEQHLVSCNPWDWGCSGGFFAFDMIVPARAITPAPCLEACFPYTALDSACAYCASRPGTRSPPGPMSAPATPCLRSMPSRTPSTRMVPFRPRFMLTVISRPTPAVSFTSCKKQGQHGQPCHHPLRLGRRQGRLAAEELLGHGLGREPASCGSSTAATVWATAPPAAISSKGEGRSAGPNLIFKRKTPSLGGVFF